MNKLTRKNLAIGAAVATAVAAPVVTGVVVHKVTKDNYENEETYGQKIFNQVNDESGNTFGTNEIVSKNNKYVPVVKGEVKTEEIVDSFEIDFSKIGSIEEFNDEVDNVNEKINNVISKEKTKTLGVKFEKTDKNTLVARVVEAKGDKSFEDIIRYISKANSLETSSQIKEFEKNPAKVAADLVVMTIENGSVIPEEIFDIIESKLPMSLEEGMVKNIVSKIFDMFSSKDVLKSVLADLKTGTIDGKQGELTNHEIIEFIFKNLSNDGFKDEILPFIANIEWSVESINDMLKYGVDLDNKLVKILINQDASDENINHMATIFSKFFIKDENGKSGATVLLGIFNDVRTKGLINILRDESRNYSSQLFQNYSAMFNADEFAALKAHYLSDDMEDLSVEKINTNKDETLTDYLSNFGDDWELMGTFSEMSKEDKTAMVNKLKAIGASGTISKDDWKYIIDGLLPKFQSSLLANKFVNEVLSVKGNPLLKDPEFNTSLAVPANIDDANLQQKISYILSVGGKEGRDIVNNFIKTEEEKMLSKVSSSLVSIVGGMLTENVDADNIYDFFIKSLNSRIVDLPKNMINTNYITDIFGSNPTPGTTFDKLASFTKVAAQLDLKAIIATFQKPFENGINSLTKEDMQTFYMLISMFKPEFDLVYPSLDALLFDGGMTKVEVEKIFKPLIGEMWEQDIDEKLKSVLSGMGISLPDMHFGKTSDLVTTILIGDYETEIKPILTQVFEGFMSTVTVSGNKLSDSEITTRANAIVDKVGELVKALRNIIDKGVLNATFDDVKAISDSIVGIVQNDDIALVVSMGLEMVLGKNAAGMLFAEPQKIFDIFNLPIKDITTEQIEAMIELAGKMLHIDGIRHLHNDALAIKALINKNILNLTKSDVSNILDAVSDLLPESISSKVTEQLKLDVLELLYGTGAPSKLVETTKPVATPEPVQPPQVAAQTAQVAVPPVPAADQAATRSAINLSTEHTAIYAI